MSPDTIAAVPWCHVDPDGFVASSFEEQTPVVGRGQTALLVTLVFLIAVRNEVQLDDGLREVAGVEFSLVPVFIHRRGR